MKALPIAVLVSAVAAGAFLFGAYHGHRQSGVQAPAGQARILYYVDPMNPAHTSEKPGLAPCGMKMEPVYAEGSAPSGGPASLAAMTPGTVRISPEKQQLIGIQVGVAEKKPFPQTLRLLGRVATDETRVYRINATVNGWVTRTLPYATGSYVRRNDVLASFYSPEFLAAGQAMLFALNSKDRVQATLPMAAEHEAAGHEAMESEMAERSSRSNRTTQFFANIQSYEDSLRNLGMGEMQIEEMKRNRKFIKNVDVTSPADAFIIARNLSDGQRFEKGTELYRLADLSRVWILADVFEDEADFAQPGAQVRVSLPKQHRTFTATVSKTLPQFDGGSRTLKLRLEADNPDFALKPDMFVDVEIPIALPAALVVAADAVLDAGRRQTVFVDRGSGVFEPRPVETGRRWGEHIEILQGLMPGERVVTAGNFLLDSESRMKLAALGLQGEPAKDPVCGMMVEVSKAKTEKRVSEHSGRTFYFCHDGCKRTFDKNPVKFIEKAGGSMPAAVKTPVAAASPDTTAVDPVCGMQVSQEKAKAANRVNEHQGKTYFFCNDGCKRAFVENPAKFTTQSGGPDRDSHQPQPVVSASAKPETGSHDARPAPVDDPAPTLKDPVCGMEVDLEKALAVSLQSTHRAMTVFFCSQACKGKFDKDPDKFLKPADQDHDDPPAKPAGATKPRPSRD
jgi:membrane fusion protein, copper/silver efflux system